MNNENERRASGPGKRKTTAKLVAIGLVALFLTGCFTFNTARYLTRTADGSVPWWCQGSTSLTPQECQTFAVNIDLAVEFARDHWTYGDGQAAAGASVYSHNSRIVQFGLSSTFNPELPNYIEYEGTASGSRAIGVGWLITGDEPEGFEGSRDTWFEDPDGNWQLPLWVLRGYENHPDLFASSHPCQADLPLTSTAQACYISSHTVPLDVLVTNDDGYDAPGIDQLVEALRVLPGVSVTVVAPLTQQSGQGGNLTPGGATNAIEDLTTASEYPVLAAVEGTPGDAINWALKNLSLSPDVVISGINGGQNMGNVGNLFSGTVGAARQAARQRVPAIATSQGLLDGDWEGFDLDYPAGVVATLALFEKWRIGADSLPLMELPNINIPTCGPTGSIRGTVTTIVAESLAGRSYGPANCDPAGLAEGDITDDVDAFNNGFTSIADIGVNVPPNYP